MASLPLAVRRVSKALPTHADLTAFILSILPTYPNGQSICYQRPHHKSYNPSAVPLDDIVLSIAPTEGLYSKLQSLSSGQTRAACFLYRPSGLLRYKLPHDTLVLSNQKRFDERLTTGWNVRLAKKLSLDLSRCQMIQGYDNDPKRRIGLVAPLTGRVEMPMKEMLDLIRAEFGGNDVGELHPALIDVSSKTDTAEDGLLGGLRNTKAIRAVAMMNEFGVDEVRRAVACAERVRFIDKGAPSELLYLTGEARDSGLAEIQLSHKGMRAFCLGNRVTEENGLRYLASRIKEVWESVTVHTVFEDEELPRPKNSTKHDISLSQIASLLLTVKPYAANEMNPTTKQDGISTAEDSPQPRPPAQPSQRLSSETSGDITAIDMLQVLKAELQVKYGNRKKPTTEQDDNIIDGDVSLPPGRQDFFHDPFFATSDGANVKELVTEQDRDIPPASPPLPPPQFSFSNFSGTSANETTEDFATKQNTDNHENIPKDNIPPPPLSESPQSPQYSFTPFPESSNELEEENTYGQKSPQVEKPLIRRVEGATPERPLVRRVEAHKPEVPLVRMVNRQAPEISIVRRIEGRELDLPLVRRVEGPKLEEIPTVRRVEIDRPERPLVRRVELREPEEEVEGGELEEGFVEWGLEEEGEVPFVPLCDTARYDIETT